MDSTAATDFSTADEPQYRSSRQDGVLRLSLTGPWLTRNAVRLNQSLHELSLAGGAGEVEIDGSGLGGLDSTGAWLVLRLKRAAEAAGKHVRMSAMPESFAMLVKMLDKAPHGKSPPRARENGFTHLLERIGRGAYHVRDQAWAMLGYLGLVTIESGETVILQRRFRLVSLITQIEETGLTALPILGLLSFLIGVVIAYQGVDQLQKFGAQIFTVNLVSVSILRELGVLIAAIIVAGRSGSAFTAQIGTMKLNQEIDALQTMGVNVVEILVLPRIVGLVITLPLVTVFADAAGLLGGAMMCYFSLDIGFSAFLHQMHDAISLSTFLVGVIKAPVFAFLIAFVGCFEGLNVEGDAGSVGRLTTRSVVESIFLVIVFDAGFSILFSVLGV